MCALAGALKNWIKISPTSTGRMSFHKLLNRERACVTGNPLGVSQGTL